MKSHDKMKRLWEVAMYGLDSNSDVLIALIQLFENNREKGVPYVYREEAYEVMYDALENGVIIDA